MSNSKEIQKNHIKLMQETSLICCSAGPDSIFLTEKIAKLSNEKHHLVYFNHQLRPNEVANEITIVSNLCRKHNYHCHIIDLELITKNQHEFRQKRLKEIHHLCQIHQIKNVFLGHHLNDDLETLMMQLFRGATTTFRGISEITNHRNIRLIHPLLKFTKKDILHYLNDQNITYAIDSSNKEIDYSRNKIRHLIETFNDTFPISQKSVINTLKYLKENERKAKNDMLNLNFRAVENSIWIKKKDLTNAFQTMTSLKLLLEKKFNQHINIDEQAILKAGLEKTKQTVIDLQSVSIHMDYKWILIKSKLKKTKMKPKLQQNITIKVAQGYLCSTDLNQIKTSNYNRLFVTNQRLKSLSLTTIENCMFKIPGQKKQLREKGVSPVEQTIYPVIHDEKEVIWIPSVFYKTETGNNCITFYNEFI